MISCAELSWASRWIVFATCAKKITKQKLPKIYQTRARLAHHQNAHRSTSDLPKNLSCDACQYKRSNKDYMKNHKTSNLKKPKPKIL